MGLRDWIDRFKIMSVQEDPEWQLAASLGDMEFEQDMYDDFQGDIWTGRDEDALRGLRKHSKEGFGRYADYFPLQDKKNWLSTFLDYDDMIGSWEPASTGIFGNDYPALIDINMLRLQEEEPWMNEVASHYTQPGSLQDKISDVYRHEYKHSAGLEHPEIYSQWEQNLDPYNQVSDYMRDAGTNYTAPDRGDWGPGVHLNRGGIVSLGLV